MLTAGGMDQEFTMPAGRGDGARHPGGPDPREKQTPAKPPAVYVPDTMAVDELPLKSRNFR
jgi:error-prone DNA polymerase